MTSAFGSRVQEQRVLLHDEHLVLVVHPTDGGDPVEPLIFWRSPTGDWRSSHGKHSTALRIVLTQYQERVARLSRDLERASVAKQFFEVLAAVRPLEHRATELTTMLARACKLVPHDAWLERCWMQARAVTRRFQLLVLRAEDGRDFDLAQLNEEQADISNQMVVSSQRLNFLISMLLPMTALTSIFGMNLMHGVGAKSSVLFWFVVFLSLVVGAVLSWFIGRMPRQLRRESSLEKLVEDLQQSSKT